MALERKMFEALHQGDVAAVSQMLDDGMSVNATIDPGGWPSDSPWPYRWFDGDYGDTMTHLAVRYRHVEMLEMLLRHKPSLNATNNSELNPSQIIDAPNQPPPPAKTRKVKHGEDYPFSGDIDTIRGLLASIPPEEEEPVHGLGMLFDDEVSDPSQFVESDKPIESVQELFWSLRDYETNRVRKGIDSGRFNVNARCVPSEFPSNDPEHTWPYGFFDGEYGDTLLHLAVRYRYTAIVEVLLSFNPDLTMKNEKGQTASDLAKSFDETRSLSRSEKSMEMIWHLLSMEPAGAWDFPSTKEGMFRLDDKRKLIKASHSVHTTVLEPGLLPQGQLPIQWLMVRSMIAEGDNIEITEEHDPADEGKPRHGGVTCDVCTMCPIVGTRYKKGGSDYDLCQGCFDTLGQEDRDAFTPIEVSDIDEDEEGANVFLCEEKASCYEKSMIRAVSRMLESRGDKVKQVLVQPRKIDLMAAFQKHFESNKGKVAGIFYIGHGGASGRWELNSYEESFGWDELVEAGFMKLKQGLLILDSCFSAVTATQAIQACQKHAEAGEGSTPALAITAASNKPQKNYSVDWVLDVCASHRIVVPGSMEDPEKMCVVIEDLKTGHIDYDPFYMFFTPPGFSSDGNIVFTL